MDLVSQIKLYPAFIFDMDGTIINSEPLHHKAWRETTKRLGIKEVPSTELLNSFAGFPLDVICTRLCKELNFEHDIHALGQLKCDIYREQYLNEVPALPKMVALLKELHASNKRISLATSTKKEEAMSILTRLNLTPYFHAFITGDMVENGKPNPDIFLMAANALNAKPEDCIVFEDADAGMLCAKNANMGAVRVFEDEFQCDHIIMPDEPYAPRDNLNIK